MISLYACSLIQTLLNIRFLLKAKESELERGKYNKIILKKISNIFRSFCADFFLIKTQNMLNFFYVILFLPVEQHKQDQNFYFFSVYYAVLKINK